MLYGVCVFGIPMTPKVLQTKMLRNEGAYWALGKLITNHTRQVYMWRACFLQSSIICTSCLFFLFVVVGPLGPINVFREFAGVGSVPKHVYGVAVHELNRHRT